VAFCAAGLRGQPDHGQRLTTPEAGSVITRTLEDLQAPDELTQHFTRFGLATTHMLTPESTVAYQHELLAGTDLVDEVSEGTRCSFERLRTVYIYGVLEYEFFTVAGEFARLVVEQALRDRFLTYHHDGITLVNTRTRQERVVQVESFEDVRAAFKQSGGPWKLKLKTPVPPMTFSGMQGSTCTPLLRPMFARHLCYQDGGTHPQRRYSSDHEPGYATTWKPTLLSRGQALPGTLSPNVAEDSGSK
jgi:hypothetical protein